jgi:hypothetical protein
MGWKLAVRVNSAGALALPSFVSWYAAELTFEGGPLGQREAGGVVPGGGSIPNPGHHRPASLNS